MVSMLAYEAFVDFLRSTKLLESASRERSVHIMQLSWMVIDHYNDEEVTLQDFLTVCKAFLLYKSMKEVIDYVRHKEKEAVSLQMDESGQGVYFDRDSNLTRMRKSDAIEFRDILRFAFDISLCLTYLMHNSISANWSLNCPKELQVQTAMQRSMRLNSMRERKRMET
jgi:alpha-L-arabinofuranosidase